MYGKINLMGHDELIGRLEAVEVLDVDFIQFEQPIFEIIYQDIPKRNCGYAPALKVFSGKFENPINFRPNAIYSLEELPKKEVLGNRFNEYESLPSAGDDLPF